MLMNMAYGAADKQEAVLMNNTEQWLSTGNCDVCRRRKYCSKPCKPAQTKRCGTDQHDCRCYM